jgi:hypothetical protein
LYNKSSDLHSLNKEDSVTEIRETVQRIGTTRVRPDPNVLAQRIDDELVVIHLVTNQIYHLNSTAARLWELLETGLDLDEAKQELMQEFEVSIEQLEQDVSDVLASLAKNDLIKFG